jgi:hypothetical protein
MMPGDDGAGVIVALMVRMMMVVGQNSEEICICAVCEAAPPTGKGPATGSDPRGSPG